MDRSRWRALDFLVAVSAVALMTVFAGLALAPIAAQAQTPPFTIGTGGASVTSMGADGSAVGSVEFDVAGAAANDGAYVVGTTWGADTIGALGLDALGGPLGLAILGIVAANNWFQCGSAICQFNPNSPAYSSYTACSSSTVVCYQFESPTAPYVTGWFPSYSEAMQWVDAEGPSYMGQFGSPCTDTPGGAASDPNGSSIFFDYTVGGTGCQYSGSYQEDWALNQDVAGAGGASPQPPTDPQITPAQLAQAIAQQDPGLAQQLVNSPNGQALMTPNVVQAYNALAQSIGQKLGLAPSSDPSQPTPSSSTAFAPQPEPAPSSSTVAPSGQTLPGFCNWASVVCGLVNWMEQKPQPAPPPVPLPMAPAPSTSTWSSGLGNGACPAPYTFTFNDQTYSLDMTPMCDLMTDIRYLVLAACALIAAFIVSGSARSTL